MDFNVWDISMPVSSRLMTVLDHKSVIFFPIIINRYRRWLETCPQVKTSKSGHAIFLFFPTRPSDEYDSATTFGRFRLYRLKLIYLFGNFILVNKFKQKINLYWNFSDIQNRCNRLDRNKSIYLRHFLLRKYRCLH